MDARGVASDITAILDRSRVALPRLLHGCNVTKWPLYEEALRLNLDARIGFEDGRILPSGDTAKSNAEPIRAARNLMNR